MQRWQARVASSEHHALAEGPVWDQVRSRLLWVDIERGELLVGAIADGRVEVAERHRFGGTIGAVAVADDGRMVVAGTRELLLLDAHGQPQATMPVIDPARHSRLNDGGCDPDGRFLIGSMALDGSTGAERLWRLEPTGLVELDGDLSLSNGLGWSPDGSLLYHVDSGPGIVWVRDDDRATGHLGARRPLVHVEHGTPDGLCIDLDGHLWVAIWGAGEVRRYDPGGRLVGVVEVAAPNPTSVAFVGPGLDTLLITTARVGLDDEQRRRAPDAGRLFVVEPGVRGTPVATWSGQWP